MERVRFHASAIAVTAAAESVVDVVLRALPGGVITCVVENVGDANAPELTVRADVVGGRLLVGSATIDDQTLADLDGVSALATGLRMRDLEPGRRVRISAQVVADGVGEATVKVAVESAAGLQWSNDVSTSGVAMVTAGERGFTVDAPVVATTVLALPEPAAEPLALARHEDDALTAKAIAEPAGPIVAEVLPIEPAPTPEAAPVPAAAVLLEQPAETQTAALPVPPLEPPAATADDGERSGMNAVAAASLVPVPKRGDYTQPLRLVPAVLELSPTWLRAVNIALDPLVKSPDRSLVMHALVLRFFLPERIIGDADSDASAEVNEALTTLIGSARAEALKCATIAGAPTFQISDAWIRTAESPKLIDSAQRYAEVMAMTTYFPLDGETKMALVSDVDVLKLKTNVVRRYGLADKTATCWLFLTMFPTRCVEFPALSAALVAYREAFEAMLDEVGAQESVLMRGSSQELDDALTTLADELQTASASVNSVAA